MCLCRTVQRVIVYGKVKFARRVQGTGMQKQKMKMLRKADQIIDVGPRQLTLSIVRMKQGVNLVESRKSSC